jgi:hypothetical protein
MTTDHATPDREVRRRVRRAASLLALLALAIYTCFILFSVLHGHR